MAANKLVRIGPVVLSNTLTTNIVNPPTLTGGVNPPATSTASYLILRRIRIINITIDGNNRKSRPRGKRRNTLTHSPPKSVFNSSHDAFMYG